MFRIAHLPKERLARRAGIAWLAFALGVSMTMPALSIDARGPANAQVPVRYVATPPAGAGGLCATYDWACARSGKTKLLGDGAMETLRAVNSRANRIIRPVSDMQQYRTPEYWALPTQHGGDCEDYALYKKRELIRLGIPPEQLLIAAVLDKQRRIHAVLVVRTGSQDLVLDNLTSRIVPWNRTGYTFLRLQDPDQPSRWVAVYAGGMFPLS